MMNLPEIGELFDLGHTLAAEYLSAKKYPHEAVAGIGEAILSIGRTLGGDFRQIAEGVWVAEDATVHPAAVIEGPCIIGHRTEVRVGAYIRGKVLIGDGAVIGNSTELKNAILFDGVQVPHYNYVGDSILGYRAHMGAGAIASNFRADHGNIAITDGGERLDTGLRKLGAMLGDYAEVGCNAVLCPGCIIGRESIVYPLARMRGILPARHIFKGNNTVPRR